MSGGSAGNGVMRKDGRGPGDLRPLRITRGYMSFAEGSALVEMGLTKVICTATLELRVPAFLRGEGKGWITAEYSMLPRSAPERISRESYGRPGGRSMEIQRLIGRSLRAVADLEAMGEVTFILDCDVLQADGGTRTASINGAYVALYDAMRRMVEKGEMERVPLKDQVAAVSVGIVDGELLLDLDFDEDLRAEVDMNVVMTGRGRLVEVQGTAEKRTFTRQELDRMLDLAWEGIQVILRVQREVLGLR